MHTVHNTVYDIPLDVWRRTLLHLRARDVCAYRGVDRHAARLVVPFVPHTQGPVKHCSRMGTGHSDAFVWMIEQTEEAYDFESCFEAAAGAGHLEILEILKRRSLTRGASSLRAIFTAVFKTSMGHLPILL